MTTDTPRTKLTQFLDANLWPMIVVGILTATVAMNMVVVTIATQHSPELMAENYYEQGVNLKQVVNEKVATARSGWKVSAVMADGEREIVMLTVLDAVGIPCDSLSGSCSFYRPSDKRLDQSASQIVFIGSGRYAIKTVAPLARGAWECVADLSQGERRYHDRVSFFVN